MQIGPLTIAWRQKALPLAPLSGRGGWWSIVREPYMGAWQRNAEIRLDSVIAYGAVFACVTLIASDVAKLGLRLVELTSDGVWVPTESPAFSPVLRKPNRYQSRISFIEQWMVSKLIHGNTYVLKQRDGRNLVTAMYVLDPTRVTPLVAPDGSIYYELRRDDLSRLPKDVVTVPASEIIHDTMVALYHPLMGVSPIYACATSATEGLTIQENSKTAFANAQQPGTVITAPKGISEDTARQLKHQWETEFSGANYGKVAVIGGELSITQLGRNAVDAQLIEQLKWTGENVCSCFHVPPYMVDIGPPPPYANVEPLVQKYYSQAIQTQTVKIEYALDEGLGMTEKIEGRQLGTEFDTDDLIWLDTAARTKAASDGIGSGGMKPNEARKKYFGLGPVPGGDSCYLQQQYFSLEALAKRDSAEPPPPTVQPPPDEPEPDEEDDELDTETLEASFTALMRKELAA